jgi:hypothetical protein
MKVQFSLHAHPRYLMATDIGAFLLSVVVLFGVSRIPLLFSPLAFGMLTLILAAGFAADIWLWFARGIRIVEVDGERLSVYTGKALGARTLDRAGISTLRVAQGVGRRTVVVKPRSGATIRIREDAFPRDQFSRFLLFIRDWR